MRTLLLKKGNYLILEDSKSSLDDFYIVETGQIIVASQEPCMEKMEDCKGFFFEFKPETKELGPGEFFGLLSPILGFKRFESAWAKVDSKILCVNKKEMHAFIQQYKDYSKFILTHLFEKLRHYNRFFSNQFQATDTKSCLRGIMHYFYDRGQMPQALYTYKQLIREQSGDFLPTHPTPQSAIEEKMQRYLQSTDWDNNEPKTYQKNNMCFFEYKKGHIIFCESELGDQLFLIKSGQVRIVKINAEGSSTLDILGKEEIFGEMAVLNNAKANSPDYSQNKRSATAITNTETLLVGISREKINTIFQLDNFSVFVEKLLKTLLKRIWHTKLMLVSRALEDPLDKITAILYSEIFKKEDLEALKRNTRDESPVEFDFGLRGLIERIAPASARVRVSSLPIRFSLNDFLRKYSLKTKYSTSIIKNKPMFTMENRHIVCLSPLEIVRSWEKIKKVL